MSLNKKTLLISFITLCLVVFIIVSIVNNNNTKTSTNLENTENIQNTETQTDTTSQDIIDNQVVETKLSISEKCIGCGKCARIDSEHFYIQGHNTKAKVISSKNLASNNLKTAIAICPVDAINLN